MVKRDKSGKFEKGHIAYNKGVLKSRICGGCESIFQSKYKRKYCSRQCWNNNRSVALSLGWSSTKRKEWLEGGFVGHQKKMIRFGNKNANWKGDDAGYTSTHTWVHRKLGKASSCSFNPSHKSPRYHWANISGNYLRDTDDYASLCPSCHKVYDLIVKKNPAKESYYQFYNRRWR